MGITPFRAIPPMSDRDRQRFWSKVEKTDACWLWKGMSRRDADAYGIFQITFETEYGRATGAFGAHRVAYTLAHGRIPDGLEILHSCDVRRCVNPAHLRPGTTAENAADKTARNRHPRGGRLPNICLPRTTLPTHSGEKHTFAKLTDQQVVELRTAYAENTDITARDLARRYGVSAQVVIMIITGEGRKSAGGPTSKIRPIIGKRVHNAKLTEQDVLEIRRLYAPKGIGGPSGRELAKRYGVTFQTISDVVRGKDWKHLR